MIKSFLNYTGNKYRILSQILPLFPKHCTRMIDLFGGSGTITLNYQGADSYVFNDNNKFLIDLIEYVSTHSAISIENEIDDVINKYELSNTTIKGYDYYGNMLNRGLSSINKSSYLKLRDDYNHMSDSSLKTLYLYVLTIFSFNNQIRFNKNGMFNTPVGKCDFNETMRNKLITFSKAWKRKSPYIISKDFYNINTKVGDFIYADPPYSITVAPYNRHWSSNDDLRLFDYLDKADNNGIQFALSNVLRHKGRENIELIKWSQKYNIINIENTFEHASYNTKHLTSEEVLITNYEV